MISNKPKENKKQQNFIIGFKYLLNNNKITDLEYNKIDNYFKNNGGIHLDLIFKNEKRVDIILNSYFSI